MFSIFDVNVLDIFKMTTIDRFPALLGPVSRPPDGHVVGVVRALREDGGCHHAQEDSLGVSFSVEIL